MSLAVSIIKNFDVGIVSSPVLLTASIVTGFQSLQGEGGGGCSSVIYGFSVPFRVITVLVGLPLLIYTVAKWLFIGFCNVAILKSLPCLRELAEFQDEQLHRAIHFLFFSFNKGLGSDGIDHLFPQKI